MENNKTITFNGVGYKLANEDTKPQNQNLHRKLVDYEVNLPVDITSLKELKEKAEKLLPTVPEAPGIIAVQSIKLSLQTHIKLLDKFITEIEKGNINYKTPKGLTGKRLAKKAKKFLEMAERLLPHILEFSMKTEPAKKSWAPSLNVPEPSKQSRELEDIFTEKDFATASTPKFIRVSGVVYRKADEEYTEEAKAQIDELENIGMEMLAIPELEKYSVLVDKAIMAVRIHRDEVSVSSGSYTIDEFVDLLRNMIDHNTNKQQEWKKKQETKEKQQQRYQEQKQQKVEKKKLTEKVKYERSVPEFIRNPKSMDKPRYSPTAPDLESIFTGSVDQVSTPNLIRFDGNVYVKI